MGQNSFFRSIQGPVFTKDFLQIIHNAGFHLKLQVLVFLCITVGNHMQAEDFFCDPLLNFPFQTHLCLFIFLLQCMYTHSPDQHRGKQSNDRSGDPYISLHSSSHSKYLRLTRWDGTEMSIFPHLPPVLLTLFLL